jgi:hypothetical protein
MNICPGGRRIKEKYPSLAALADGRRHSVVSFHPDFVGSTFGCGPAFGMLPTVTHDPQSTLKAIVHC